MAKKSKIARDQQRRIVVAQYAEKRALLKEQLRSPSSTDEQRAAAAAGLQRLPRDASPTRLRNRDVVDGRPRAYFRAFGLSRVRLREMAHRGELPGVSKSSW
ncbi:30S ribosomal protein S14 [Umezawaea sp. NPDC059074]|uniref:30S ribosomal protein S14 n=1 Tax=Umezawaea sp. NPDC059074 TaxID=3346716 RepID=UPI0036AB352A